MVLLQVIILTEYQLLLLLWLVRCEYHQCPRRILSLDCAAAESYVPNMFEHLLAVVYLFCQDNASHVLHLCYHSLPCLLCTKPAFSVLVLQSPPHQGQVHTCNTDTPGLIMHVKQPMSRT